MSPPLLIDREGGDSFVYWLQKSNVVDGKSPYSQVFACTGKASCVNEIEALIERPFTVEVVDFKFTIRWDILWLNWAEIGPCNLRFGMVFCKIDGLVPTSSIDAATTAWPIAEISHPNAGTST